MADKRTLAKRDAQIRTVQTLMEKANTLIEKEAITEKELSALLKNLQTKQTTLNEINEKIIDTIDEEKIVEEMERSTDLNLEIDTWLFALEDKLKKFAPIVESQDENRSLAMSHTESESTRKNTVKLPKLLVKKFYGEPTAWQEFIDTFNAAVNENVELTPIEKFTYLRSYMGGEAEKCLEGLKLSAANYSHALELLEERFGNKQIIISKYMNSLLSVDKVRYSYHIKELRALYDNITVNIRGLLSYEIDSKQFSPMLVPVLMQKLPNDIKLELSKKLNKTEWNIDEVIKLLRLEIEARESYSGSDPRQDQSDNNRARFTRERRMTTENLLISQSQSNKKCQFCKQEHYSDKCTVVTDRNARLEAVKRSNLCYRCLSSSHRISDCNSRKKCFRCQSSRHHTAICNAERKDEMSKDEMSKDEKPKDEKPKQFENSTGLMVTELKAISVILQTANAVAANNLETKKKQVRILLDPGSQRTYITTKLAKDLCLIPVKTQDVIIKTFGNDDSKQMNISEFPFCVKSETGANLYFKALAVPLICSSLSGQKIEVAEDSFRFLKGVNVSSTQFDKSGEVDVLIGSDYYWTVVNGEIQRSTKNRLVALNTKLGWIYSGPVGADRDNITTTNLITHAMKVELELNEDDELSRKVDKFWELDSMGMVPNEASVYDKFIEQIELKDGRYQVRLPFKESHSFIEDNFKLSLNRLMKLKSKMCVLPHVLKEYDDVIAKQLESGIIEKVETPGEVGRVTYLPHRAVIREDKKTTKLRVVFDASARNQGPSLNDCLYKGPCLNPLLYDMLIRFRIPNIAITADIKQAFLQISVHPDERDYLRFLWFDDVFNDKPKVVKYRFNRVMFGATCSQFLLNGAIKVHLQKFQQQDPEFTEKISNSFYVDDLNTGVDTVEEAMILHEKLRSRFSKVNMELCQWRTNNEELRRKISDEHSTRNTEEPKKVLGVKWDEYSDELVIDVKDFLSEEIKDEAVTKREVLSIIASFYDPVGYIQPIIIKMKIFFQEICSGSYGWDDVLNQELLVKWKTILKQTKKTQLIRISRCYSLKDIDDPFISVELIGFSDASLAAYGCCIYFKFISRSGNIKVSFVTSKSRVAPLKRKETIPRLELLGNLLLSRLVQSVSKAAEKDMRFDRVTCFTDSQVSLSWVRAENKEFKTFVQNRVIEIRRNVAADNWFYCRTHNNPADIVTRIEGDGMQNPLWWEGPSFLKSIEIAAVRPRLPEDLTLDFESEIKVTETMMLATQEVPASIDNIIDIHRYSDLLKLYRVTALVVRFVRNLKAALNKGEAVRSKHLVAKEIKDARNLWVAANQMVLVASPKYKDIETQLNCKKDETGIIRTYGRMKNAKPLKDSKHPVMLSKNHRLSILILSYCHLKVMHRGVKQTLNEFRAEYWVTSGRSFVKKILLPCTLCKRLNGRPYAYPGHSDLPAMRFDERAPFSSTGCDYLGPLHVLPIYGKDKCKTYKAYVLLYTCASTRAVILEVVNSANTEHFIQSFRRFISRRGCPSMMLSDQGSSFVAQETQKFATNRFIDWKFNVACAPWWGGMWERLVSCVKRCLKKTIGTMQLNYVELQTMMLEIEVILNNRPLCPDYDEDQEDVLTPNHLVFGRRLETTNVEESGYDSGENDNLTRRNLHLKQMQDHFWIIWRKEYLTYLRESHKCSRENSTERIRVGDVVIIYDRYQPRHLWKLGRIIDLIRGSDQVVRAAKVKSGTKGAIITRPLNKLYPLEVDGEAAQKNDSSEEKCKSDVNLRPKRNSAIIADLKIKYGGD